MEKITVEGIVLNETNYGETSKILNVLTKELGYISLMSKGCRTLKSKYRGISMNFSYANYTISYKENGISTLLEGATINPLMNILTNLDCMNYATYLTQIVKKILKENNDLNIYPLLKNALLKINDKVDPHTICNIVEIKLLSFLGVEPEFKHCLNCDSLDVITFDIALGGMVCKNCYHDTYLFKPTTLKLLRLFQEVDISKIDKINISAPIKKK